MLPLSLIYGKSSFGNGKALEKFVVHRANQIVGSVFLGPFCDAVILDFTINFGSDVFEKCVALEYLPKMRKKIAFLCAICNFGIVCVSVDESLILNKFWQKSPLPIAIFSSK